MESKKGNIWISNMELRQTKQIRPEQLNKHIEEGWIKYRMFFNAK